MELKDKVALITGASSGIGKAIALLFARRGAAVVLTARHLDKLGLVKKEITENNGKAECFAMDIASREQVKKTFEKVIKKYKKIDILVNNAGIAKWGTIDEVTYDDFIDHININLIGYFNCIKEAVPYMEGRKAGSIINIITSTVKKTKSGRVAYAASKYGQAGLSNAVHEDLKYKGISVVAVYPGKTDTPIHDYYMSKSDPARKKMLKAEKVAEVVLKAALIHGIDVKEIEVNP